MKNIERYGKGKSWDLVLGEDGQRVLRAEIEAYAWKDHAEVTLYHGPDCNLKDVAQFLHDFAHSIDDLAKGETIPEWICRGDDIIEPGDEDWPF